MREQLQEMMMQGQPPAPQGAPAPPRPQGAMPPPPPTAASPQVMNPNGGQQPKQRDPKQDAKLQQAYQRGATAASDALYSKKSKLRKSVMKMISKDDPVGSTAKAITMFMSGLATKATLPPRIMPSLAVETGLEIMALAEQEGVNFDSTTAQQTIVTMGEMILSAYGVSPEEAQRLGQQMGQQALAKAEQSYQELLNA